MSYYLLIDNTETEMIYVKDIFGNAMSNVTMFDI
jgi:hypothetical protein